MIFPTRIVGCIVDSLLLHLLLRLVAVMIIAMEAKKAKDIIMKVEVDGIAMEAKKAATTTTTITVTITITVTKAMKAATKEVMKEAMVDGIITFIVEMANVVMNAMTISSQH
jgi:hypothetical protein